MRESSLKLEVILNKKYKIIFIFAALIISLLVINKVALLVSLVLLSIGAYGTYYFDYNFFTFSDNLYESLIVLVIVTLFIIFNPIPFIGEFLKGIFAFTVVSVIKEYFRDQSEIKQA